MARTSKTILPWYYHVLRVVSTVCTLTVGCILAYFTTTLKSGNFKIPWTFLIILLICLATLVAMVLITCFTCCNRASPLLNLILDIPVLLAWTAVTGVLSYTLYGTLGHSCVLQNWGNSDGIMVCNIYKVLFASSIFVMLSQIALVVLGFIARRRQIGGSQYENLDAANVSGKSAGTDIKLESYPSLPHPTTNASKLHGGRTQNFRDEIENRASQDEIGWRPGQSDRPLEFRSQNQTGSYTDPYTQPQPYHEPRQEPPLDRSYSPAQSTHPIRQNTTATNYTASQYSDPVSALSSHGTQRTQKTYRSQALSPYAEDGPVYSQTRSPTRHPQPQSQSPQQNSLPYPQTHYTGTSYPTQLQRQNSFTPADDRSNLLGSNKQIPSPYRDHDRDHDQADYGFTHSRTPSPYHDQPPTTVTNTTTATPIRTLTQPPTQLHPRTRTPYQEYIDEQRMYHNTSATPTPTAAYAPQVYQPQSQSQSQPQIQRQTTGASASASASASGGNVYQRQKYQQADYSGGDASRNGRGKGR